MRRYLAHFPAPTIRVLLADREFIGADWLTFLNDNNVPFAIRVRENLRVTDQAGHELTLPARLARRSRSFTARMGTGEEAADAPLLTVAAKRLKDEWLIVALALVWAGRAASNRLRNRAPARKAHGHLAQSWFRTGFDHLRHFLASGATDEILKAWKSLSKQPQNRSVVECGVGPDVASKLL